MAINMVMPFSGDIPKVIGKQSATHMVEVSPGIEPKIIPTTTPIRIIAKVVGLSTDTIPSIIIIVVPLPYSMPVGKINENTSTNKILIKTGETTARTKNKI